MRSLVTKGMIAKRTNNINSISTPLSINVESKKPRISIKYQKPIVRVTIKMAEVK